jgi:hypothetical protein
MLVAPDTTFVSDGRPAPRWIIVAREHALPLIVPTSIVYAVLLSIFPPSLPDGTVVEIDWLLAIVVRSIGNFVGLLITAGIVRFFAGRLGGAASFDASFVLVALAMTPLFLAEAILPLPVLGVIVTLVGLVYSMVLLFRGLVPVLDVPPPNRGRVFGLSVLALFAIFMAAGLVMVGFLFPG